MPAVANGKIPPLLLQAGIAWNKKKTHMFNLIRPHLIEKDSFAAEVNQ